MRESRSIVLRGLTRLPRRQEGAAAVEFALISVVLFLVIFGIIQFGIWLSQYQVYEGAAREGARLAAVRGAVADVQTRTSNAASPYALSNSPAVEVQDPNSSSWTSGSCTSSTIGWLVRVEWTQNFTDSSFALIPSFGSRTIKGVFRCE